MADGKTNSLRQAWRLPHVRKARHLVPCALLCSKTSKHGARLVRALCRQLRQELSWQRGASMFSRKRAAQAPAQAPRPTDAQILERKLRDVAADLAAGRITAAQADGARRALRAAFGGGE